MKLLILGGTRFLGYHLVTAALARQHDLTLFHRGKHAVAALPHVEMIYGDRNQAAEEVLPSRVLSIRPGLIVGAYDYTDRFTYWAVRVARGGEVLAPGRPQRDVQFIDVRDLADWIVQMVERRHTGIYNATGLPETVTMATVLEACRTVSASDASFTWVSEPFLLAEHVTPWTEMPLWIPEEAMPHMQGLMAVNCQKAQAAGLHCRALHETISDTWQWHAAQEQSRTLQAGLSADREQQLLQKWHTT